MDNYHLPVLLHEVLGGLAPRPGAHLVDGTLGAGGHAAAWLEASGPNGRVTGFDRDPAALALAAERLAPYAGRIGIIHASHTELARHVAPASADAVLLDLGFSSMQIDDPARGFSFQANGPLDMRFDPTAGESAADLVNTLPETSLADLIYEYGEERFSRRVARAICLARPLYTTHALAEVVRRAVPRTGEKIDPATRTFQALRIAVNGELEAIRATLPQAVAALRPGGRLAVISFHSLEDRIVKEYFRREAQGCICPPEQLICTCQHVPSLRLITRKPITATPAEIDANPRARSAKLRVAEKVGG